MQFPSSAVGTRLENVSVMIAVGLHLGADVCTCLCGEQVIASGTHGLSCRNLLVATFDTTQSTTSSDVRWCQQIYLPFWSQHHSVAVTAYRLDGLTIVPWACGGCLVWDFTYPDTLAANPSTELLLARELLASDAEGRKKSK